MKYKKGDRVRLTTELRKYKYFGKYYPKVGTEGTIIEVENSMGIPKYYIDWDNFHKKGSTDWEVFEDEVEEVK